MEYLQKPAAYVISGDAGAYLYKGSTRDLATRWAQHASGRVARTRARHPLKLVYVEYFDNYTEIACREFCKRKGHGKSLGA